ncbi:hypothetical protein [Patulibacter minatonensis]|uniref:hypothetical protein n=1 Tax=Patulibacter minatonensis TaxID=298163 RepID=UPI00047A2B2E|nr:hypothetical protein [Patulibacter minatonensis]
MAQPKNKKRRSRKRARAASGGGAPAKGTATSSGTAAPGPKPQPAKAKKVTQAQRAQKAREARKAAPGPPSVKADRSEAPQAIWHPLPITEVLILVGLVVAVVGLFSKSTGLVLGGLALLVLSSLELAVREHMAGYRSHSSLISAVCAMVSAVGLGLLLNVANVGLPQWPLLFVAIFVFAGTFRVMRLKFKEKSGGLTYRV